MGLDIELLLFDLGGVLIELNDSPLPTYHPQLSDWLLSETVRKFEVGLISSEEFACAVKKDLLLEQSVEDIISHFKAWPKGFYPGAIDLLNRLKANCKISALTNTNEIHWSRITEEFQAPCYFDSIIASHQVGMAKPDVRFFQYAIEKFAIHPNKIMFMDDNIENVAAASRVGINSYLTRGFLEVVALLSKVDLSLA
ncbi:HAD-IA family hydrolase [Microbulbifer epialgicus]|uniref:HAD-IA family hydrolase n=1 Tax=Microbulbifer epialgicus TaxID=393907 RepID=A0ABV4NX40_9GAMM